jgi:putative intracellular protease/amidase
MRVDIVVYDGVDEMDVLGPLQVLRDATSAGAPSGVDDGEAWSLGSAP